MSETWEKVGDNYEISDTVTVRTVNRTRLERRKASLENEIVNLTAEIATIDVDIDKIDELEASSSAAA